MRATANALEFATAAMLVAICVIVFVNVFFRYFLHIGLGWTEELARYLQVWMTFLGATVAVKRWTHFQLTIVDQVIPGSVRRFTRLFAILVVMLLAAIMIKHGIDITRVTWNQSSPVLGWPIGYLYLMSPVCGVLMVIFALRHLMRAWRGEPDGPPGDTHATVPVAAE
ncbi:MAG TPA: TRAP transporter small permease [Burkholderiales bacterium]|nr:TRAP transporter small permease [Burkholderiales bacterium]